MNTSGMLCCGWKEKTPRGFIRGAVLRHVCEVPRCATFYLIGEETQPLQEVLHQLEFVPDGVLLHLSSDLPGLLAHALLQGGRCQPMVMHANSGGRGVCVHEPLRDGSVIH